MLPSLVIGLREGLEAALIVGIVAAFLKANGRTDLLRWVWAGVAAAVVLCLGVGIGLRVASENLPYRQQEALETVIALVAVAMVTYMVVWMRRHARDMKSSLEGAAGAAIDRGSGWALVAMAFLAVLREGFETAVFLVAAFNESDDPRTASTGALIGIVAACILGYGIYRGGVRIDLARFFRITGVVLVLVAAGLVVAALHSAHEADWINIGQQRVFDLTWLVDPGSVRSSLLTGILGLQPRPVLIELIGWLVYLVPVLTFVLWPAGKPFPRRAVLIGTAAVTLAGAATAITLNIAEPAPPEPAVAELVTNEGDLVVDVMGVGGGTATLSIGGSAVGAPDGSGVITVEAGAGERTTRGGRETTMYRATVDADPADAGELSLAEVAELNGGRLPLGVDPTGDPIAVESHVRQTVTVWLDDVTGTVIDAAVASRTVSVGRFDGGPLPLGAPNERAIVTEDGSAEARAETAAFDAGRIERIDTFQAWERGLVALAVAAAIAGLAVWLWGRLGRAGRPPSQDERSTEERRVTAPNPA